MNDNLLSVPQFAKMATRSKQSIYEATKNKNSKLYPYVVIRDNRVYIKAAALKLYQDGSRQDNQDSSQVGSHQVNTESQGGKIDKIPTASQNFSVGGPGQGQGVSQDYGQGQSRQNNQDKTGTGNQDGSHQDNQTGTGSSPGLAEQIIGILQEQIREKDREIQEKNRQLAEKDNQINKLIELANHAQLLHAATKREQLEETATQPEPVIDTAPIEEKPIEIKKKRSLWARLFGGE